MICDDDNRSLSARKNKSNCNGELKCSWFSYSYQVYVELHLQWSKRIYKQHETRKTNGLLGKTVMCPVNPGSSSGTISDKEARSLEVGRGPSATT